jgi:cytochrome c2
VNVPIRLAAALALLAAGHAAQAAGDPTRGARVFQKCYACHSLVPGERNLQGPSLVGLWGRRAGVLPDVEYSEALVEAGRADGLRWDETTLDAFLADPQRTVPGVRMGFFGIPDPDERADLIAYLKAAAR